MGDVIDMRAVSASRTPRPLEHDPTTVREMLEGATPSLALCESEVVLATGRPPQNLETGEGYVPGFSGLLSYWRSHHFTYRREDGRVLHYEYEGDAAYALAEIQERKAA